MHGSEEDDLALQLQTSCGGFHCVAITATPTTLSLAGESGYAEQEHKSVRPAFIYFQVRELLRADGGHVEGLFVEGLQRSTRKGLLSAANLSCLGIDIPFGCLYLQLLLRACLDLRGQQPCQHGSVGGGLGMRILLLQLEHRLLCSWVLLQHWFFVMQAGMSRV